MAPPLDLYFYEIHIKDVDFSKLNVVARNRIHINFVHLIKQIKRKTFPSDKVLSKKIIVKYLTTFDIMIEF